MSRHARQKDNIEGVEVAEPLQDITKIYQWHCNRLWSRLPWLSLPAPPRQLGEAPTFDLERRRVYFRSLNRFKSDISVRNQKCIVTISIQAVHLCIGVCDSVVGAWHNNRICLQTCGPPGPLKGGVPLWPAGIGHSVVIRTQVFYLYVSLTKSLVDRVEGAGSRKEREA